MTGDVAVSFVVAAAGLFAVADILWRFL